MSREDAAPNIVLITTHDTGRHLSCYGVGSVHSPNLERLAAQGCRFTEYFAAAALCSPSRGAMMTGRYPQSNGMLGLCHGLFGWSLNDDERHLSHLLHEAGYYTALIGHQHETTDIDGQLCFDEHRLHWEDLSRGLHTTCDQVAEGVGEFLRERAGQSRPFYLQVGFFETHRPFDFGGAEPDDSKGVYVPPYLEDNQAARDELAAFQGNIRKMDAAVGEILRHLDDARLAEHTLVIYSVDHGIPFPRAKATLYDPGIEIALLMRWPGRIEAGSSRDWLLSNVDLVPTVLDLAGLEAPDSLEGHSFASAFEPGSEPTREMIFAEHHGHGADGESRCVRTPRQKLIRNFAPQPQPAVPVDVSRPAGGGKRAHVELYDLENDPLETQNVADSPDYADLRQELDGLLWNWLERVDDPILRGPVATPYYRAAILPYRRSSES
ncbi:MAG: sulfatase [Candidatus Brocadiia bacterium]